MQASRTFVVAYMATVTVLSVVLLAPLVIGALLRPDPLEPEDIAGLAYWFGLVGMLWAVGMAAGLWALRRLRTR